MAVIKYFLPGLTIEQFRKPDGILDRSILADMDLEPALRDIKHAPRDCTLTGVQSGPGGDGGVLLTPRRADGKTDDICIYAPDRQHWIESINRRYWLGSNHGMITALDLLRRKAYVGYIVSNEEIDGHEWLVPVARSTDESRVSLPRRITFGATEAFRTVKEQYVHLWELAGDIVDWCAGQDCNAADDDWRIQTALTALNVNYRLWRDEVNLSDEMDCPILSTELIEPICLSIADLTFAGEAKKNASPENGRPRPSLDLSTTGIEDGADSSPVGAS